MPRIYPFNLNKCCSFNGTNSSVSFTVPTSMNPANLTSFTTAAWIKPNVIDSTARRIGIEKGTNSADGKGFLIYVRNVTDGLTGTVSFDNTQAQSVYGFGLVKVGSWQRILMTWSDADNVPKMYVNGILLTTTSTVNKVGSRQNWSGTTAYVGNRSGADRAWSGLQDEVCLWNRILTAQEISDDYYKGIIPTNGLILEYKMDEASGNLVDSSASGLTGTPSNITQNVTSYSTGTRTAAGARSAAGARTAI